MFDSPRFDLREYKRIASFDVYKDGWFRYICRKYFDGFVTKYF